MGTSFSSMFFFSSILIFLWQISLFFLLQSSSRGRVAGLLVLVGVGGFLGCYFTRGKDKSLGGPYKNQTVSSLLFFFWVTVDREHAWGRAAKPRNEGGSPSEEKIRLTAMRTLIWRFAAFHASLIDSCLLLKSDTISRAFFCKQTASILTAVWLEALVLFLSVRYCSLMIVSLWIPKLRKKEGSSK